MALSGVISTIYTAQQIVDSALKKLGVLGEGETATGAQFTDALQEANLLLKSFQMEAPNLWTRADATVTLVSGTHTYTLTPRPRTVENMRFAIDGTEMRPLTEWSRNDFDRFPQKTSTGTPNLYIVDRQRTSTSVRFWPVPSFTSGAWTVPYSYERVIEDLISTSDDVDIPQEGFDLLINDLALRMAVPYQMIGQPHVAAIEARVQRLYQLLAMFDRRGDIEFQLNDVRTNYIYQGGGRY